MAVRHIMGIVVDGAEDSGSWPRIAVTYKMGIVVDGAEPMIKSIQYLPKSRFHVTNLSHNRRLARSRDNVFLRHFLNLSN
jgi:hypothetical protein